MKQSKVMKERIRRVRVLFTELGYEFLDGELFDDTYSAGIEHGDFQAGVFIDRESKFLELAFTFSFPPAMEEFIRDKLEEMFQICYEFGCYTNVQTSREDITFSLFSKLHYAGMNYFSLKETVRDFRGAITAITEVLEISPDIEHEGEHGYS
ncbi:MAG: hypothetical protein ACOCRN_03405 [Spirochaetia bacterium]